MPLGTAAQWFHLMGLAAFGLFVSGRVTAPTDLPKGTTSVCQGRAVAQLCDDVAARVGWTVAFRDQRGVLPRGSTKVHRAKLQGQRHSTRGFDRQVAEIRIRAAILNGFTALGIPRAKDVG
jgi:hypothetical protein